MDAAVEDEGIEKCFSDTEDYFLSILCAIQLMSPHSFRQDDERFHFVPSVGGESYTTAIVFGAVLLGKP